MYKKNQTFIFNLELNNLFLINVFFKRKYFCNYANKIIKFKYPIIDGRLIK